MHDKAKTTHHSHSDADTNAANAIGGAAASLSDTPTISVADSVDALMGNKGGTSQVAATSSMGQIGATKLQGALAASANGAIANSDDAPTRSVPINKIVTPSVVSGTASAETTATPAASSNATIRPKDIPAVSEVLDNPSKDVIQKKKHTIAALLHPGTQVRLSQNEVMVKTSLQKRVIGDRADLHWAILIVMFLCANLIFGAWHIFVFRGIATGDLFNAPALVGNKDGLDSAGVSGDAVNVPVEVRSRIETFSKRNDKVIKVVDPSL